MLFRSGTTVNPFQYRGEQYDASLQMYYLRARYYRPDVGRFLTQDPYEGDDEDPVSHHQYMYGNADPVGRIDPSGYANLVENSLAGTVGRITSQVFSVFNTAMRSVTLGRVQRGAKLAFDTICCLNKTWAVLDLSLRAIAGNEGPQALQNFATSPTHVALLTINIACRLKCGDPGPFLDFLNDTRGGGPIGGPNSGDPSGGGPNNADYMGRDAPTQVSPGTRDRKSVV